MNRSEAYSILGLDSSATNDEVQASFRKLAKKWHPDRNPDKKEAEEKFKQINAAYQCLQKEPEEENIFGGFESNFVNFMRNSFSRNRTVRQYPPPNVDVKLTFVESVLGTSKNITYVRKSPCKNCNGEGDIVAAESCAICGGGGVKHSTFSRGNIRFMSTCDVCHGTGKKVSGCSSCSGEGVFDKEVSVTVKIPSGVVSDQVVRLGGAGHFVINDNAGRPMFGDVLLKIDVEKDPEMHLDGLNVISTIDISLVEALKGMTKEVRTVKGPMKLKIKPGVRNNDKVRASGYGAGGYGDHIFIIDVKYPEQTDDLISFLENKEVGEN